jgi:hypothetical protein
VSPGKSHSLLHGLGVWTSAGLLAWRGTCLAIGAELPGTSECEVVLAPPCGILASLDTGLRLCQGCKRTATLPGAVSMGRNGRFLSLRLIRNETYFQYVLNGNKFKEKKTKTGGTKELD